VASAARTSPVSAEAREAELQDVVRRDALEVLSMQIDVEEEQRRVSARRDSTWSVGLLGLAIGIGARELSRRRRS
jgi:hypothetical protein